MTHNDATGVDLLAPLTKRRDFLVCARGKKAVRTAFVLQMAERPDAEPAASVRVGFTASRKIGKAVQRNRAKRRLRAAARAVLPGRALAGCDYVLVARAAVLTCRYADLEADLRSALAELTKRRRRAAEPQPPTVCHDPSAAASIGS